MVKLFAFLTGSSTGHSCDRWRIACVFLRHSRTCHFLLAASFLPAILMSRNAFAMTADGAMITNYAAATGYWGMAGLAYTSRYNVSYNATAGVVVSCPVVYVTKIVSPTTLAVAQTATYTVCVVNTALQATAWNVVVQDRLPDNMAYVGASLTSWVLGTPPPTWTASWSTNGGASWTTGAEPPAGANNTTAPYSLRWVLNYLGPNRSGCVSFRATVQ